MKGDSLGLSAEECKQRGNEYYKEKEYDLAIDAYTEAILQSPQECAYWLNRCNAYRQLNQWTDAENDAAKALELDPSNAKAHYGLIVCLQRLGQLQDALHRCDAALTQHAENKALLQLRNEVAQEIRVRTLAAKREEQDAYINRRNVAAPSRSSSSSSSSSSREGGVLGGSRVVVNRKVPRELKEEELPCKELCDCAARGDAEACKRLLDSGDILDVNWKRPEDGNTALHVAAEEGHAKVARVLLAAGASPEVTNDFLLTPFVLAEKGGQAERVLSKVTRPLDSEARRPALRDPHCV